MIDLRKLLRDSSKGNQKREQIFRKLSRPEYLLRSYHLRNWITRWKLTSSWRRRSLKSKMIVFSLRSCPRPWKQSTRASCKNSIILRPPLISSSKRNTSSRKTSTSSTLWSRSSISLDSSLIKKPLKKWPRKERKLNTLTIKRVPINSRQKQWELFIRNTWRVFQLIQWRVKKIRKATSPIIKRSIRSLRAVTLMNTRKTAPFNMRKSITKRANHWRRLPRRIRLKLRNRMKMIN